MSRFFFFFLGGGGWFVCFLVCSFVCLYGNHLHEALIDVEDHVFLATLSLFLRIFLFKECSGLARSMRELNKCEGGWVGRLLGSINSILRS